MSPFTKTIYANNHDHIYLHDNLKRVTLELLETLIASKEACVPQNRVELLKSLKFQLVLITPESQWL